jgi:hypothetical protein
LCIVSNDNKTPLKTFSFLLDLLDEPTRNLYL